MCHAINEDEHEVQTEENTLKNTECGYEICVPLKGNEKHTVSVCILFSGPFVLPDGYTLVSAVYDITMPELSQPATIELEHCVDESDQTRSDLCFAIGSVDLRNKKIIFEKVDQEFNGSIEQKAVVCYAYCTRENCKYNNIIIIKLLVSTNFFREDKTSVRYAAQCFYEKKCKNFWILNIAFTKHLKAHFKVFISKMENYFLFSMLHHVELIFKTNVNLFLSPTSSFLT